MKAFWDARVLPILVEHVCGNREITDERRRWIPRATGRVLEIGIGSGLNLPHYRDCEVVGLDPSPQLIARAAAKQSSVPIEIVEGTAEALPFPDRSFDTIVTTYTLCSVGDPGRALAEARRVMRPEARVIFVEHGLAPDPGPRAWQRRITPAWRIVGGNCHLDRDLPSLFRDAGLAMIERETGYRESGPRWFSYRYQGIAASR